MLQCGISSTSCSVAAPLASSTMVHHMYAKFLGVGLYEAPYTACSVYECVVKREVWPVLLLCCPVQAG